MVENYKRKRTEENIQVQAARFLYKASNEEIGKDCTCSMEKAKMVSSIFAAFLMLFWFLILCNIVLFYCRKRS